MATGSKAKWAGMVALAAALWAAALVGRGTAQPAPAAGAAPSADDLAAQVKAVHGMTQMVQDMASVADSRSASSVATILAVNDTIKDPQEAIAFYERSLSHAEDDAVQRALRIQLAQLYRQTGETGKALDQYQRILTAPIHR